MMQLALCFKINELIYIYMINNNLKAMKNGTKDDFYLLSRRLTLTEQFTNHFMNDLKKLAYFSIDL